MTKITELVARILLGHMFLLSGISKISAYTGTQGYMEAMGIPGALLPAVIGLEIVGGLALMLGIKTRLIAYGLAGFSVGAAIIFHADFSDQIQMIMFMKNWTIAGGLLLLAVHGSGELSLERKFAS